METLWEAIKMKTSIMILTLGIVNLLVCPDYSIAFSPQATNSFEAAYNEWQRILDVSPLSGEPFYFDKNSGSTEQRNAIKSLLTYGPEAVPSLVELMRHESSRMHLYRALQLLEELAGINTYMGYKKNIYEEVFALGDQFLGQWDSGAYSQVDKILELKYEQYLKPGVDVEKIPPQELAGIRYYGIYALPFIAKAIKIRNSPECYAAFLIITKQRQAYAKYIENPKQDQTSGTQKMDRIRQWYADNRGKFEKLNGLEEKIRKEVLQ
jgi:hypothetical protein